MAEERSGASEASGVSVSPFVCGAGLVRAGIYDEGVFGCGGPAGSLPEQVRHGTATIQDSLVGGLGKPFHCVAGQFNKGVRIHIRSSEGEAVVLRGELLEPAFNAFDLRFQLRPTT